MSAPTGPEDKTGRYSPAGGTGLGNIGRNSSSSPGFIASAHSIELLGLEHQRLIVVVLPLSKGDGWHAWQQGLVASTFRTPR